ncbi:MAG: hypothetical protein M3355_06455 [Actinomycetota bacterium]|nr:hypothetical protein [Actinomycetota bacterium]
MSQENLDLIRRGWHAYESGDLTAVLEMFSPHPGHLRCAAHSRRWYLCATGLANGATTG